MYLRLLFLFFFPIGAWAQNKYAVADIPPELLKNANLVLRFSEQVFKVKSLDEATYTHRWAVTILNEKGDHAAQETCFSDKFIKSKKLEAVSYDASGKMLRESSKKDIVTTDGQSSFEFADNTYKILDMQMGIYPYTVEFYTEDEYEGFFMIPPFRIQGLNEAVQHAVFRFEAPETYRFKWKAENTDAKMQQEGNAKTWTVQNLPAPVYEPTHPYVSKPYAEVRFAPEKILLDGFEGDFSSWQKVGKYYFDLNANRDRLSSSMQEQVKKLTQNCKNDREKIQKIYQYLQQNHRYISIQLGIGGWQTLTAEFVEQKRYGDCKALSNYMGAMLKMVGIQAQKALIRAGENAQGQLAHDFPAPWFNHVILYVPSEDMWLECTSQDYTAGYLGDFTCNRSALLLTPEGGKLVSTPALTHLDNQWISTTDIKLDENGNAVVRDHKITMGNLHDEFRAIAKEKDPSERQKKLAEQADVNIEFLQSLEVTPSDTAPTATVDYVFKTASYAARSGRRMFVPLLKINGLHRSLPEDSARVHPLYLPQAFTCRDTITLHFPAGYEAESLPKGKRIESPFGIYDLSIEKLDPGRLRIIRHAEMRAVSEPASRYQTVRQFYLDVGKLDALQAVIIRRG